MEKEFITAEWLRKQGFQDADTDNRHFEKRTENGILTMSQNRISGAWAFGVYNSIERYIMGLQNESGYPLNYTKEIKNLAPSFF